VASAVLDGNLGEFRLWGDEIGFALGAEYRKEKSANTPDPSGVTFYTFGNRLFPNRGSFDVKEAFAELRVPIISDRPFFNDLTVNGAVRISDYSTVGTTWTYQAGILYSPIRDLRLRAAYTRAVRAPNIAELFAPQSQTFAFIADPCSPSRLQNGTELRAQNCQAIFRDLGLTPAQIAAFTGAVSSSIPGLSSGNLDLEEERAKTITAGAVFQPRFIPNLTFSVDYYDVRIDNAVATPTAVTVAQLCVDQPRPNQFCDAIDRAPGTATRPGTIIGFRVRPQNVAEFRTTGVDFAANYRLETGSAGIFNFRLIGNRLIKLDTIPTPGGAVTNSQNVGDAPKWTVNLASTWALENFALTWRANYFSPTFRFSRRTLENDPDFVAPEFLRFPRRFTHDFQANFTATEEMGFYVGVNNAFGQLPAVGSTFFPVPATGRFFYAGVRLNLDNIRVPGL
jgi:outer membrane receptor protein involved in Fe transport